MKRKKIHKTIRFKNYLVATYWTNSL